MWPTRDVPQIFTTVLETYFGAPFFLPKKQGFRTIQGLHEMLLVYWCCLHVHWSCFVVLTSARHGNYMKLHN